MIKVIEINELKDIIYDSNLIVVKVSAQEKYRITPMWTETLAVQFASLLSNEDFESSVDRDPLFKSAAPKRLLKFGLKLNKTATVRALRWLGFSTRPEYRDAWQLFIRENSSGEGHNELSEAGLICRMGDIEYYPLTVLYAGLLQSPDLNPSNAHNILARFRRSSIEAPQISDAILRYLRQKSLDDDPAAKSFGLLTDPELLEPCSQTVGSLLGHLDRLRREKSQWFEGFAAEQMEIWRMFTTCGGRLRDIKSRVSEANLSLRPNDCAASSKSLSRYLKMLADAYSVVSEFESYWGIDKLLAPQLLSRDVATLRRNLKNIRSDLQTKIAPFREHYQEKWGIWNLSDAVGHLFSNGDVPINLSLNRLPRNQKRVFTFILDGYGMVQHFWALNASRGSDGRSFSQDVFQWVEDREGLFGVNILGSTFATDTGSGLAAIFTGKTSKENGVFASKMWDASARRVKDILKEGPSGSPNQPSYCFFDDLPDDIKIKVFHGGGRGEMPTPFGKFIYGTRPNYLSINIPERIFGVLRKSIDDDSSRRLYCIYYPLIDRTGHTVGSFSHFELNEIKRFKSGLLAFLIDLVYTHEELFDSRTTFIFTADHGMFETSDRFVTVGQIRECLNHGDGFLWANRSVWIYSNTPQEVAERLTYLFNSVEITFEMHLKDHKIKNFFGEGPDAPDLIIQFTDDGIIAPYEAARTDLLLFGVHGGCSNEEVFVPFITICLTLELYEAIKDSYKNLEG